MLKFEEFKQKLNYLPAKELEQCWHSFNWGYSKALSEIKEKYFVECCDKHCENCACPLNFINEMEKKQNAETEEN